jgi:hypothetical protein
MKTTSKTRLSYQYVYDYFLQHDCLLLETEYKNNRTLMKYRCSCGCIAYIKFVDFQRGVRCRNCMGKRIGDSQRFSYEYIFNYFLDQGCILLETEYFGANIPMKYQCECGNISHITFANFQNGERCWNCRGKKIADSKKFSFEYVKAFFEQYGFTLLSDEYINSNTVLEYRCPNDHINRATFTSFKMSCEHYGCLQCCYESRKGEGNSNWNPNLTEEDRIKRRYILENEIWRKEVFQRDDYTCIVCGRRGCSLEAHHLNGYHWAIDERFDVDNGVTLCFNCHSQKVSGSFHSIYGNRNNTKEQFEEFLLSKNTLTPSQQIT